MDEPRQKIIEGLKIAVEAEASGYHFYTMTAEKTDDPAGAEAFKILAAEEESHLNYLNQQLKSFIEKGEPDPSLELGEQFDFTASPIFSDDLVSRAGKAQFEMSALSIGMQLEKSSIDFYESQAKFASDAGLPVVEMFYMELVKWEKKHYEALSRQQELLREDFWAQGGFAPF